jgi:hypothetical protein
VRLAAGLGVKKIVKIDRGKFMNHEESKYQSILLQGWVGMLFLLLTMFITDIVEQAIKGSFESFSAFMAKDPGFVGLWFLACLICANVLAQMAIRVIHKKQCRWIAFYTTLIYTLFFLTHQVVHLIAGEGFDIHFIIDITHNILGFWASWAAFKWATYAEYLPSKVNA